jgi:uncharacterized Zn-binding protein involved in type VI secretion
VDVYCDSSLLSRRCPSVELHVGINARPHILEQWSTDQIKVCGCSHAERTNKLIPPKAIHASRPSQHTSSSRQTRGVSAAAMGDRSQAGASASVTSEWLTPVAAYRRSANSSASMSLSENIAYESSLLRTPNALECSVKHLLCCVWSRVESASQSGTAFTTKYAYINDRLRQIKKELTQQSLSTTHPLLCISLLSRMVRFYSISQFLLFGSLPAEGRATPDFDLRMNSDRLNDCMQALMDCYSYACTHLSNQSDISNGTNSIHSIPDDGRTSVPNSIAELLSHSDRYRSYAVLIQLQQPWMELQQQHTEQTMLERACSLLPKSLTGTAVSASAAAAPSNVVGSSESSLSQCNLLSPHLHIAARLCTAYHTCDYVTFFSLYKQLCDPTPSREISFDPIAAFLLQQYLLPLQISALRRITIVYQPSFWFPLSTIRDILALSSVPDAALLCKSLCGLSVRRPDSWVTADLATQETESAVIAENIRAAGLDGKEHWAVQVGKGGSVPPLIEGDPLVFKAYYSRELRRRLRRADVQHQSFDESTAQPELFGLNDAQVQSKLVQTELVNNWEEHHTPVQSVKHIAPLWQFTPQTRWPVSFLQQLIWYDC